MTKLKMTLQDVSKDLKEQYEYNQSGGYRGKTVNLNDLASAIDDHISESLTAIYKNEENVPVAWLYRDPAMLEFNKEPSLTRDPELVKLMQEVGGHEIVPLVKEKTSDKKDQLIIGFQDAFLEVSAELEKADREIQDLKNIIKTLEVIS